MKIFDYLDRVRNRPVDVRRRFAVTVSVVFCSVIFLAWFMVVTSRPGTLQYSSTKNSSTTPISSIAEGFRSVTGEIKSLSEVIKNLSSSKILVDQGAGEEADTEE